jgi:bacteriocin biosynthesis cyclodehydratase domain-containing protein
MRQDAGMVLLLDPALPRVWRTPDSVQFGVDRPALVLDGVTAAEERMLSALAGGVTPRGLEMIARRSRASPAEVAALLEKVAPLLVASPARDPAPALVVLDGAGPTAATVQRLLGDAGVEVLAGLSWADPAVERADAAVLVASYAVEPQRHARWLRRDIPHLSVVYSDGGVTVGPLVSPGAGPCLRCVDLHRTDADPAWPALATQLHTLPPPGETAVAAAAAAARASAELLGRATARPRALTGRSGFLPRGAAEWVSRAWEPHPDCGCLGPPA